MAKRKRPILTQTWCEFSKPAQELIRTANRKGMNLDEWSYMDAYEVPFDKGFTRRDIAGNLAFFREMNPLTMAKCLGGAIIELDSTNMSHAGAYYKVRVVVRKDEADAAELI
jgi:hypothetical protein